MVMYMKSPCLSRSEVMTESYLKKANQILEKLKINVKDINTKSEIQNSKNFNATLTPTLDKIKVK
ncbi:hypothetical protein [Intestinibacter bartlettii]|nr:hypothetical protein [Intestinibacter bartlettii]